MQPRALLLAVLGLGLMAAVPSPAKADSCLPLLNDLYDHLANHSGVVDFLHTTNYQANGFWATGQGQGTLLFTSGVGLMTGLDHRTWNTGYTDGFELYFAPNGTVWFGPYGPYTTECYSNKFLVVNTADSYETITFTKGP